MKGKKIFQYFKFVLVFSSYLFKILPNSLSYFLYDLCSVIPGKLGLGLRYSFLLAKAKKVGENVYVGRFVTLKNIHMLTVGSNVSIHEYCFIDAIGNINFGDNVSIAHRSSIVSFEHSYEGDFSTSIKYLPIKKNKVNISKDVWVGCSSVILAGADIENRVVIAAGSVVKGKVNNNSVYAGVPARKIKVIR